MPYQFKLHTPNLLWIVVHGTMELEHAEHYFHDIWLTLDGCPCPTDMLVDGRDLHSTSHPARRRTEQVVHHPHIGQIAFVVSEHHMLLFAPLVRFVSGIGLFRSEYEALEFLHKPRTRAVGGELNFHKVSALPHSLPRHGPVAVEPAHLPAAGAPVVVPTTPPLPAPLPAAATLVPTHRDAPAEAAPAAPALPAPVEAAPSLPAPVPVTTGPPQSAAPPRRIQAPLRYRPDPATHTFNSLTSLVNNLTRAVNSFAAALEQTQRKRD